MEQTTTDHQARLKILTLTEYAARHSVTRNTIFNWMKRGKLPSDALKIYQLPGGHWRIECVVDGLS